METLKSLNGSTFQWSLPCDVNSSVPARDYQFLEEARKSKALKNKEYTSIDIDSLESQSLLDHDVLAQNFQESQQQAEVTVVPRFTSSATLQISATPGDDPISLDLESAVSKKPYDLESIQNTVSHSKYSVYIPTYPKTEEKKVDENGNALQQSSSAKAKKKKIQADKNVVVLAAEKVEGHRGDIIHDVDKLIQYIAGDKEEKDSGKSNKYSVHKSKQLHKQHTPDDGPRSKKHRAHSKGKESRSELKKSNSLGEISTAKLDDFAFSSSRDEKDDDKVVLRPNKSQVERPKERRSWGDVEPPPFQILSNSTSIENLETSDNWVVPKPKKKNKKRRNSISSNRRQNSTSDSFSKQHINRAPSPDLRGKSACSVPHSERSNDSSDADSVHSLPVDGLNNHQTSYADITKNSERLREKKQSPEKQERLTGGKERQLVRIDGGEAKCGAPQQSVVANRRFSVEKQIVLASTPTLPGNNVKAEPTLVIKQPPDVNNPKAFPSIPPPIAGGDASAMTPSSVTKSPSAVVPGPPDGNNVKALPAIAEQPPKNGPQPPPPGGGSCGGGGGGGDYSAPQAAPPPDFSNPKYFPAISGSKGGNPMDKCCASVKNSSTVAAVLGGAKTKNSTGAYQAVRGSNGPIVKTAVATQVVKVSVSTCVVPNDIQNDLSHNAQMLPPNIPDVRTIEKMHFMNRPSPHDQQPNSPQQLPQIQAPSCQLPQEAPPAPTTPVVSPVAAVPPLSTTAQPRQAVPPPAQYQQHQHHNNCDSGDRHRYAPTSTASTPTALTATEENSTQVGSPPAPESPPPVIILSGAGNKEVPGLVFGFDINEQLLHEDACENFVARWMAPQTYTCHSHNHDKIVNFIGSAWEAIVNQSNGKVEYYKEES